MTDPTTTEPVAEPVVTPAGEAIDPAELALVVEAVLLTTDRPIPTARIAEVVGIASAKLVSAAIDALNEFYEQHDRSFRIEKVAGGYQMLTLPKYKDTLAALHRRKADNKLSPAALETLAIIAYKQPIMRADVEAIRGVACGEVIRSLMDKHLIKITGRAEEIGRPMLYGTTRTFLEVFGLAGLNDLPKAEELTKP